MSFFFTKKTKVIAFDNTKISIESIKHTSICRCKIAFCSCLICKICNVNPCVCKSNELTLQNSALLSK